MNSDNSQEQSMDFQKIFEMLVRRRKIIYYSFLVSLFVSIALSFLLPKMYEASSTVLVNSKKIIDPLVSNLAVTPDIAEELNTLSNQVLTWPRLEQMVNQLHLIKNSESPEEVESFIRALKKRVVVQMKGKQLIQISYTDKFPARAQQIVNTLTQNFIEENSRIKAEDARNAIAFIGDQLKIYQKKLEYSSRNVSTSKLYSDLRMAENRKTLLQERMKNLQRIVPSQITSEQNPVAARLQARLGEIESELGRLLVDAKEGNPKIAELKKQEMEYRARLDTEKGKDTIKESISIMNPTYMQAEQDYKELEIGISYLEKRKKELESEDEQFKKPVSEQDLQNLERNKQVDEDIYRMLLRQLEAAYVSERLQDSEKGGRFTIIEYARLPLKPIKPKKILVVLFGMIFGCGLGVGFIFLLESFDQSLKTLEEANTFFKITSLGGIAKITPENEEVSAPKTGLRNRFNEFVAKHETLSKMKLLPPVYFKKMLDTDLSPQLISYHQPQSSVAEEYRVLNSNIVSMGHVSHFKTLVVTSSLKGEGKSTTTANLAVTMANAGKSVLLIDMDLRRGVVHNLFSARQAPGITDYLKGQASPEKILVKTEINDLSIIPRGSSSKNPFELLANGKLKGFLSGLRDNFDIILIDVPPVLNLADTNLLSGFADGVILVVQAGRTHRKEITRTITALEHSGAKLMGFTLTNIQYYMPQYMFNYYYGES